MCLGVLTLQIRGKTKAGLEKLVAFRSLGLANQEEVQSGL